MFQKSDRDKLKDLFTDAQYYNSAEEFKVLLNVMHRFPYMKPFNVALVELQKPGSTFVATADVWKDRFNRTVKPGTTPIIILAPFGPIRLVYELNDTEGEPFFQNEELEKYLYPFGTNQVVSEEKYSKMIPTLIGQGIQYKEQNLGSSFGGYIDGPFATTEVLFRETKENKYFAPCNFWLTVSQNMDVTAKFATLAHELGHFYCGHQNPDNSNDHTLPKRTGIPRNTREFEAEAVAYLVCDRLGIIRQSAGYLSGYLNQYNELPEGINVELILKAAGSVESLFHGTMTPRVRVKKFKKD